MAGQPATPASVGRYDQYEQKMQALRRTLDTVARYRVLLILCVLLLTGSTLGLLAAIGSFTAMPADRTYHYGDTMDFGADAFWSNVSYEYAPEDGSQWQSGLPQMPGKYRIRAVSQNGFRRLRYSREATVTVLPRNLSVEIGKTDLIYGDSAE